LKVEKVALLSSISEVIGHMDAPAAVLPGVPHLDAHLLKFSQACTVTLSALAFILQQPIIVAIAAACLAISAAVPAASPFRLLYRGVVVPLHLLKPRIVEDDPAPHRFAQAIGAVFLIASILLLFLTTAHIAGWTLDLIVFALSGLNFSVGFCAGCFVYYHLGRLGLMPRVRYEGSFHWRGV
jgi:ABC-type uncharacterized transport system permease subunit